VGTTASRAVTNDSRPIKQLRLARPIPNPYLDGDSDVRVTYHPSWVLKNPPWSDDFDSDVGWLRIH
jgi:uracil-DNA glycosylase